MSKNEMAQNVGLITKFRQTVLGKLGEGWAATDFPLIWRLTQPGLTQVAAEGHWGALTDWWREQGLGS